MAEYIRLFDDNGRSRCSEINNDPNVVRINQELQDLLTKGKYHPGDLENWLHGEITLGILASII